MIIESGTYTGDVGNTVTVSGLSFDPTDGDTALLIKGGSNVGAIHITPMSAGIYKPMAGSTAMQPSGGPTLTSDGFTVSGSDVATNEEGVTYYWTMFHDNGGDDFGTFIFNHDNTDDRFIAVSGLANNVPSFALLVGIASIPPTIRFASNADGESQTTTGQAAPNMIQSFTNGGIVLGNSNGGNPGTATTSVGFAVANSDIFYVFDALYNGTGSAHNETDSDVGFTPEHAWVKAIAGTTQAMVFKHPDMASTSASRWNGTGELTTLITALIANGITVGTNGAVNNGSGTYAVAVFVDGATDPVIPTLPDHLGRQRPRGLLRGLRRGLS